MSEKPMLLARLVSAIDSDEDTGLEAVFFMREVNMMLFL